ncbi:MAG: prepilin-type N-terminal cleavage/methylation domain-containing protein [Gammaproteobacteria bacterium]|nr:prepilin-type N-terminal cleavage/methylation domain-containing protein [Gammaproteobacteria bacterium]
MPGPITMRRPHPVPRLLGFTLIEAVVAITIIGIIAGIVAVFIVRPIQGYADLSRRAELVEAAESALRRMARDIRLALPNSVRVTDPGTGASFAVEMLPILDAAKYNTKATPACSQIKVGLNTTEFGVLACFRNPVFTALVGTASTSYRLVINNRDESVYTDTSVTSPITPLGTVITTNVHDASISCAAAVGTCGTASYRHLITLGTAHKFGSDSPNQRLFVVTTPVSYLCDTSAGTLTRYYNYPIAATQPTTTAAFTALNASSALVTDHVSTCTMTTTTSDVKNRGLATLTLGLSDEGETIKLVHQVQLDNSR